MCGLVGFLDFKKNRAISRDVLEKMTGTIYHRGPDDRSMYFDQGFALGFVRLSILDLSSGMQPHYNERKDVMTACNGEIYNYQRLKDGLLKREHSFYSRNDTEVLPHLYEEYGIDFVKKLNGQFAFSLYDKKNHLFFLARDHFGICPLFYTIVEDCLIFSSEIKAILAHPYVKPAVDFKSLDQILSFPGIVSPRTMFEGIKSLKPGEYIGFNTETGTYKQSIYWDFEYPSENDVVMSEESYLEGLKYHLDKAIQYRLQSDVPLGFYLSGGLDSSLIASMARLNMTDKMNTFSVVFPDDKLICEKKYQDMMVSHLDASHHETQFNKQHLIERLKTVIYHTECPIKETFNVAAMALAKNVRENNIKVILGGQGADELFAGYPSYKFDSMRTHSDDSISDTEKSIRTLLWGDADYFYENQQSEFWKTKLQLYCEARREEFLDVNNAFEAIIDHSKLQGISLLKRRSYIDFKGRLADHLLSDHGDRMLMSNSIEGRYPFLDQDLVNYVTKMPDDLKFRDFDEKYILKKFSQSYLPKRIIQREKFGFTAPGSPYILSQNDDYINHLLSYEVIKNQGYFDPDEIERLKKQYSDPIFRINVPFDTDLLMVVITFGIFLDQFNL